MFDPVYHNGSMANQTSLFHNFYNQSRGNSGFGFGGSSTLPTNVSLLSSYFPPSPSIYSNATSTRISNKKQSKSGPYTSNVGGYQDQNTIRRGFNGTDLYNYNYYNNSFSGGGGAERGRNKESRQRNNRKQISSSAAAAAAAAGQNSDEGPEWSSDRDSANYTEPKYYLGKLIQGTYCSRVFSDCEKRACRMQSPNYPGVYPRNLTCFYAVRQVGLMGMRMILIIKIIMEFNSSSSLAQRARGKARADFGAPTKREPNLGGHPAQSGSAGSSRSQERQGKVFAKDTHVG